MKYLQVEMEDGSKWAVPVYVIARNRAIAYKSEFDDNIELSLESDTMPLFDSDPFEIEDWAVNNMDWKDVEEFAVCISQPEPDYEEGWTNGPKTIIDESEVP